MTPEQAAIYEEAVSICRRHTTFTCDVGRYPHDIIQELIELGLVEKAPKNVASVVAQTVSYVVVQPQDIVKRRLKRDCESKPKSVK